MSDLHYHSGMNIPGYMPEGDQGTHATYFEAFDALIGDVESVGDSIFESQLPEDEEATKEVMAEYEDVANRMRAELDALRGRLPVLGISQFGVLLPSSISRHDLGLHFWIVPCSEPECDIED